MSKKHKPANLLANVHMAGEFFVAAELSKLGYLVSLTMGNAKAVDLFAERGSRVVCMQVKAAAGSFGWPLSPDKAKITSNVVYVFVALNPTNQPPDFYILTAREVRARARWYNTRAGIYIPQVRNRKNAWHVIEAALNQGRPKRAT